MFADEPMRLLCSFHRPGACLPNHSELGTRNPHTRLPMVVLNGTGAIPSVQSVIRTSGEA